MPLEYDFGAYLDVAVARTLAKCAAGRRTVAAAESVIVAQEALWNAIKDRVERVFDVGIGSSVVTAVQNIEGAHLQIEFDALCDFEALDYADIYVVIAISAQDIAANARERIISRNSFVLVIPQPMFRGWRGRRACDVIQVAERARVE